METMTKKTKIILGSAGGCLLALAVALGIWQPWKKPADDQPDPPSVQEPDDQPDQPQKEGPTLSVAGEKIPCTIFEGDGWSIYVPEGWTQEAEAAGGAFVLRSGGKEQARVEVVQSSPAAYEGAYIACSAQKLSDTEERRERMFYSGGAEDAWEVRCQAPRAEWDAYQRLMTALARTLTVGGKRPFAELYPVASEPDWQEAEGKTVLWMDKDGYAVSDEAEKAVEAGMNAWNDSFKALHTGKYRLEDLGWAASITCLEDEAYVDVFSAGVWYGLTEAGQGGISEACADPDRLEVKDGWYTDHAPLYVAVRHDGGIVTGVTAFRDESGIPLGEPDFVTLLLAERDRA